MAERTSTSAHSFTDYIGNVGPTYDQRRQKTANLSLCVKRERGERDRCHVNSEVFDGKRGARHYERPIYIDQGALLGHARRNLPVRHRWLTGAALDVRAGPLRRDGVAHLRSNRPGPTPPDRHHPRRRPNPSVGGWTRVRRAGIHVAITHAIRSISSDKSRSLDTTGGVETLGPSRLRGIAAGCCGERIERCHNATQRDHRPAWVPVPLSVYGGTEL